MTLEAYAAAQDAMRTAWLATIPPALRPTRSGHVGRPTRNPDAMPMPPSEICGKIMASDDPTGELRQRRAAWIWRRISEGWSRRNIAVRLGLTPSSVGNAVRDYDPCATPLVAPSHLRGAKTHRDEALILDRDEWVRGAVADGRTRNEIAGALRITPGAVAAILKRGDAL